MIENNQLKKDTTKGIFWTFVDFFSSQGIKFIIQLLLTRILLPEHFGLIGMILIVVAISQSIVNSGMQNALIREQNSTQVDYSTVFYFNLFVSIVIYGVVFIFAPIISAFYDEPILKELLRVLGLIIIINAFGIVQRTILTKKINFKTQTLINIISTVFSGVTAVILALVGLGVWSLVVQNVMGQLIQTILLSLHNRWKPSFIFSVSSFKRLFGFGWRLLVSGLIDTTYKNIYNIIIGRTYSTTVLGYYTQATMLRDIASNSITLAVQKVTYPVLSKIQDKEKQLLNGYRTIIKNSVFVTFPLMIGLAAIANNLIPFLFGENWKGTVPYFQILCLAGMLYPLQAINLNILQVKGRSDLFLRLEIIKKIIGVCLIIFVVVLKLGMIWLVWTLVISSISSLFINTYFSGRLINYPIKSQFLDIIKTFISAAIMGILVFFIGLRLNFLLDIYILILQILFGCVVFIGLSIILKSYELYNFTKYIKNFAKK
ncbi:lipopolysaccharide biosynthesis protein [Lederbergia graminis]|uniref:Lipopolysaccharide biosynthesis protein n=1 Tax=Lederbergia graminis TaxID=735518 RepID=A0ABW0LJT1_9BACI